MKLSIVLTLLVSATLIPACAEAQQPGAPVAVTASYQLAPSDIISINVVNFTNLSVVQAVVAPDGTVAVPLLDNVTVSGMTTAQTARLLTKRWRKYVINPAVSVSLMQKHIQNVVFSGWLTHPGTLSYRPGLHLIDALAEAGGSLPSGDPTNATLTHVDGSKELLDLSYPEKKADDPIVNCELAPGDVVYVPEQRGKVSVVGMVRLPGSLTYNDHLTVLEAINASGGALPEVADLKASTFTHNGVESKIDLDAMLLHGDMSANATMSPDDRINIPELHNKVYVFGDVARPGFYYFKPGDRIVDALGGVGGPLPQADLGKINVMNINTMKKDTKNDSKKDSKNEEQMARVNLNDFLLKGKYEGNPFVTNGDTMYIPDKHHTANIGDLMSLISGVGSAAYTARVLNGH
jgi:polysaccharide export outer membrane protein